MNKLNVEQAEAILCNAIDKNSKENWNEIIDSLLMILAGDFIERHCDKGVYAIDNCNAVEVNPSLLVMIMKSKILPNFTKVISSDRTMAALIVLESELIMADLFPLIEKAFTVENINKLMQMGECKASATIH